MIVAATSPAWAGRYGGVLAREGDVRFVADGAALADLLAREWSVDVVILDLALATDALAARLGPDGPRLLAFGDTANSGLALAGNLADFIPDLPEDGDLVAAVAAAVAANAGVADLSDRSTARLGALGVEAKRIAAALARLASPADGRPVPPVDVPTVRALIRARRARDRFFPAELFGDPAWDMLLDLTIARARAQDVSVSSLCLAAGVPPTTALRWIRNLCDLGLFERTADPRDARRAFITLPETTARAMAEYLAAFALPGS